MSRVPPSKKILPFLAVALWAPASRAQGGDPGAVAEALFRDGRELMAAGRVAEACPKFAESNRLDPKLGTLMNLALCHEKEGKSASAWAEYLRSAEIARRLGQPERETVARDRARSLETVIVHVVLSVDAASAATQVMLDDEVIGAAAFGTPIPLDPGDHVLRASATGRKPFSESFHLEAGAASRALHVPALDPAPAEAAPAAPLATRHEATPAPSAAPASSGRRTLGWILGGGGVALVGVGAFFGLQAFASKRTAEDECNATWCTQTGLDAISTMKTSEAVSTITIFTGVAAMGAGAYFVLSAGGKNQVRLGLDGRGVRVAVRW